MGFDQRFDGPIIYKKMAEDAPAAAEIEIKTDFEIPKMAEPKIDPNLDDFTRMRLEKDLKELKRMIETHFQIRKKDEEELQGLKDRIEKRKLVREQQIAERAIREKKRQEEEKAERLRKKEEGRRRKEEGCIGCYVHELRRCRPTSK